MTQYLPPHLLAMFAPRPPLEFQPPIEKRKNPQYSGISSFLNAFETREESDKVAKALANKPKQETIEERRERRRKEKLAANTAKIAQQLRSWNPNALSDKLTSDPYKTLFVTHLNYITSEQKLRREFEEYGSIRTVRIVKEHDGVAKEEEEGGKPRGYAFIEFETDRDMKNAYKLADGRKIDERRVIVDVERGRTVRGWLPRRLGGGRGQARISEEEKEQIRMKEEQERMKKNEQEEREKSRERSRDHHHERHHSHHSHHRSHHNNYHEHDDRRYSPY